MSQKRKLTIVPVRVKGWNRAKGCCPSGRCMKELVSHRVHVPLVWSETVGLCGRA